MDSSTEECIFPLLVVVLAGAILSGGVLLGTKTVKSSPAYKIGLAVIEECGKPAVVCEYEYLNGDSDE